MSSELQLDVWCLSCCGGDIWWMLTKERHAWCYLQVKLCDPCLSALSVPPWPKKRYINTLPFLFPLCTQMQPTVTDWVAWSVILVSPAKTAEPIKIPFGLQNRVGPCVTWGAHWRDLANTTEPSICSGDRPFCQITLTTCLTWHYVVCSICIRRFV